ncbi:hypothetical protein [Photobacterium lipolyticum]|uniref:Lipoprotein n=1 Tax=Photobacterium lipolyticum TaxID=266810 RepID=A0A2T3N392_9GAMM|nr:hypothetical protein [Photobacterium lipolyticum]PSW06843.1 hypothetical protein C9I89_04830 [Photobacterium lipolyticum]
MKNFKTCILSALISSALIGCGGGGGGGSNVITDDSQAVSYDMENIVEAFLNSNIEYTTSYKTEGYSSELEKFYDKNNNTIDFKIPTNTIAKGGCKANPLSLDNRSVNLNGASFNVEPIDDSRRLVSFTSLPKTFVNTAFGKQVCIYSDFSYTSKYIIGNSNEKLVDLSKDESVFKPTDFFKLSTVNRLLNTGAQTTVKDAKLLLKPYLSSELNYAEHEFIVNKNGEVKTFDNITGQYVALPDTTGEEWQFYSDKYIVSKPRGGSVSVYDIALKQRVKTASISALQNLETNLNDVEKTTLSYGIWSGLDNSSHYGIPFKLVSENYGNDSNLYLWDEGKWVIVTDFANTAWYISMKYSMDFYPVITKSIDSNIYINQQTGQFIAANNVSNSGFNLVSGKETSPLNTTNIPDFAHYLNNVHLINDKVVIETSDRVLNYENKSFYLIDSDKKKIVGNTGENITVIKPSSHN